MVCTGKVRSQVSSPLSLGIGCSWESQAPWSLSPQMANIGIKRHAEHAGTVPRQPHHLALKRPPGSGRLRASAAEAPSPRAFAAPHFPFAAPEWPRVQLARQTLSLPSLAPSGSVQSPPCPRPMSLSTRPLLTLLAGSHWCSPPRLHPWGLFIPGKPLSQNDVSPQFQASNPRSF